MLWVIPYALSQWELPRQPPLLYFVQWVWECHTVIHKCSTLIYPELHVTRNLWCLLHYGISFIYTFSPILTDKIVKVGGTKEQKIFMLNKLKTDSDINWEMGKETEDIDWQVIRIGKNSFTFWSTRMWSTAWEDWPTII